MPNITRVLCDHIIDCGKNAYGKTIKVFVFKSLETNANLYWKTTDDSKFSGSFEAGKNYYISFSRDGDTEKEIRCVKNEGEIEKSSLAIDDFER